ncbi:SUN domain-containing protein 1-like [Opisthocomus hoazin]|uniref:SUN domain-containing protein 1-like n=1 Tax=Opisthocomus hoazin TaxID=30419 RepID=UPI003F533F32
MAAAMMAAEQEAVKGGGRNRGGVQRVEGKLRASVEKGDCYEAHQMYRTLFLRWLRVTFVIAMDWGTTRLENNVCLLEIHSPVSKLDLLVWSASGRVAQSSLDGEGNPKFNYGFIFFPSAFYSMVTSDGDTDSNALEAFLYYRPVYAYCSRSKRAFLVELSVCEEDAEAKKSKLASNFVSKSDLQPFLRDLELQILQKIALHMSVTSQKLTSAVVTKAVTNAGVRGITEAQVQTIVNNALKLFSQDKTGMVDFALESGGGSILSARCSETYDSKTAVISLFGIPLWYLSQPPRVVIQPDVYPGNCWAFKGSQGYLVVRLSRKIYPTAFTLEHIPKALSATGEISSALRSFAVYGLDNEYQEGGKLLGQYVYDQDGEPLQTFPVMEKSENAFQIVELRVFSNWGHPEYTCLYRFRVHGKLAE